MCDYSLMAVPNRLAHEGEDLVAHRFPTGSLGLASPADLKRAAEPCPKSRTTFWRAIVEFFDPPETRPVAAVCIPPGARLVLRRHTATAMRCGSPTGASCGCKSCGKVSACACSTCRWPRSWTF